MRNTILVLISLLLAVNVYAGEILYPTSENPKGEKIVYSDKYSLKDFTGRNLLNATDLEGAVVYGSCFSQETPETKVFSENIKKITLINCNTDNVYIKSGWITKGCSNRLFLVQNDLSDLLLDKDTFQPIEPLDKEERLKLGISILP